MILDWKRSLFRSSGAVSNIPHVVEFGHDDLHHRSAARIVLTQIRNLRLVSLTELIGGEVGVGYKLLLLVCSFAPCSRGAVLPIRWVIECQRLTGKQTTIRLTMLKCNCRKDQSVRAHVVEIGSVACLS